MNVYERLRSSLTSVRIAHHVSGRVRLKLVRDVHLDGIDAPDRQRVDDVLARTRGVHSVRTNLLARSCVVEYDPAVIPDAAWPDLLAGTPSPASAVLDLILRETIEQLQR